ncbi:MAG: glycosyltransferase [Paracoccaceae bacterium]
MTILLCTLNGARFLEAQLQSYLTQSHQNWALWVSDDGSTDGTLALLEAFHAAHGDRHHIRILRGPRQGAATNYLSLLCHPDLPPGLVALSDQDDIWLKGKLARALAKLTAVNSAPAIYSAQSIYIDAEGRRIGRSHAPTDGAPVFQTAMLQNVMAGHSMVLNPAALALVRRAGSVQVQFHDWWLTLLITASGGQAVMDPRRGILYRQHAGNVLGAPGSLRAAMHRAGQVLGNRYGTWVRQNAEALVASPDLAPDARQKLEAFLQDQGQGGIARIRLLRKLGFHRQSRLGTSLCYLAAALGRL